MGLLRVIVGRLWRAHGSWRAGAVCTVLLLSMSLWNCTAEPEPLELVSSSQGEKSHFKQPIIQAGDFRKQGLWNDPCVLKTDKGGYVMYLTSSVEEPFKPPVLPFRAVSQDGLDWELSPKEPLLSPKSTPFVSLETPSVVRFGEKYHMFYTGIYPEGQIPPMAIGHAVSPDGVVWETDSEPFLTATATPSDWNGYLVGEPGAVVYREKLYLYFTAIAARAGGNPPQSQTIGLMTSSDGVTFDEPRRVHGQSALYPPDEGYVGYSTPSAIAVEDTIHLFYDVAYFDKRAKEWQQVALHHACSADGESGWSEDAAPLFTREDFTWTTGAILAPTAVLEDSELKLWFAGHVRVSELAPLIRRGIKGSEFGIGFASIDPGVILKPSR